MFCLLACSAITMSACEEGTSNKLDCDAASYKTECMDKDHIMTCENGVLTVTECGAGNFCQIQTAKDASGASIATGAACVPGRADATAPNPSPENPETGSCTHEYPVCNNNNVETCINGIPLITECKFGCTNGTCNTESPVESSCTVDVCMDETTLLKCNTETGQYVEETCPNGCAVNSCIE